MNKMQIKKELKKEYQEMVAPWFSDQDFVKHAEEQSALRDAVYAKAALLATILSEIKAVSGWKETHVVSPGNNFSRSIVMDVVFGGNKVLILNRGTSITVFDRVGDESPVPSELTFSGLVHRRSFENVLDESFDWTEVGKYVIYLVEKFVAKEDRAGLLRIFREEAE